MSFTYAPHQPFDAIIFDCDGTLCTIEGIDELARLNGVYEQIKHLTAEAMERTGLNKDLYQKRLELVRPTLDQVIALGQHYYTSLSQDCAGVIATLLNSDKKIYIMSAGIAQAVRPLAKALLIPESQVYAVDLYFDQANNYQDFDRDNPLTLNSGKKYIVQELSKLHSNLLYIGDGLNDVVVRDEVARFVGYGGAFYRPNIEMLSDYYIRTPSLAPLLPLSLTKSEVNLLSKEELDLYRHGVSLFNNSHFL